MKTFQINILSENDVDKVLNVLKGLVHADLIEIKNYNDIAVSPSNDQLEEIIDESELSSFYTPEEVRDILHM